MQYVINASTTLSAALLHAMKDVLGIAATSLETVNEGPHRVTMNGRTHEGLQAILLALRTEAATPERKAFLGEDPEQAALVNQWVYLASIVETDAARAAKDASASVAKALYAEVEKALANTPGAASAHLSGSPRATIADVLVYAAAFNHPLHAEALPTTMAWAAHAQEDAYVAPIKSAAVKPVEHAKGAKAETSTYVKPSEEEILRRRAEKEKAKAEKEAAKAAAGGSKSEAAAAAETSTYVKPSEEEILRRRAEKEKAKAEKEAAKAAAGGSKSEAAAAPSSSTKGSKAELDHSSLYIRVGQLTDLRRHPNADRLYIESMVLGDETRTIVSGLVEHYTVDELEGTQCLVVCNMKPKPLMGVTSTGMVLCAKKDDKVRLIRPPAGAQPGDRVLFGDSFDAAAAAAPPPEPVSGNKMSEVLAHLHTNSEGDLCWKEATALLASGEKLAIAEMPECPVS